MKSLPDPEYLRELFRATPDGLVWAEERPAHHFRTKKGMSVWKAQCAGKPTGRTVGPNGVLLVYVDRRSYMSARVAWAIANRMDPGAATVIHLDGDKNNLDPRNLAVEKSKARSGLRWVYRAGNKWIGGFTVLGVKRWTSRYETPEAAHAAVIEERRALDLPV